MNYILTKEMCSTVNVLSPGTVSLLTPEGTGQSVFDAPLSRTELDILGPEAHDVATGDVRVFQWHINSRLFMFLAIFSSIRMVVTTLLWDCAALCKACGCFSACRKIFPRGLSFQCLWIRTTELPSLLHTMYVYDVLFCRHSV